MSIERDRAEGMLDRLADAARRSDDFRRWAVSAGVKPQKAAVKARAMYGRAYDRMGRDYNSRAHTPFGNDEEPF